MHFNKKLLVIPVILIVLLFAIRISTMELKSGENEIFISGNIEITKVDVSFKIPGRVIKRLVTEGDHLQEGEDIALLDDQEILQEIALRQAQVQESEARLQEIVRGYLPEEIAQAKARQDQAKANFENQKNDFARQKNLLETDVISQKEFELAKASYHVAEAKLLEAKESYRLLKKGARPEKVDQAKANLKASKEALNLAKTKLDQTLIKAPILGYVISENVEAGEVVSAGTSIVTIGNLQKAWLRAYISEKDLGKVKLGQKVMITTDSYPEKEYIGQVSFISPQAEFTPKNVQTEKERVKLVYRIKVDIDNQSQELKPGMPANGLIILGDDSGNSNY
jgi:HlyD family secretion protein